MNVEKVITFYHSEEVAETCCVNTRKIAFNNLSLYKEVYYNNSRAIAKIYLRSLRRYRREIQNQWLNDNR